MLRLLGNRKGAVRRATSSRRVAPRGLDFCWLCIRRLFAVQDAQTRPTELSHTARPNFRTSEVVHLDLQVRIAAAA